MSFLHKRTMNGKRALLILAFFVIPVFAGKPDSASVIVCGKNTAPVLSGTVSFVTFQQDQTASVANVSSAAAIPVNNKAASLRQLDKDLSASATHVAARKKIFISGFDRFLDLWR